MTFREFLDNAEDFKDHRVIDGLKEAFLQYLETDIDLIREDIARGNFEFISDLEADDAFGTEGMNI